MTAAAVQRMCPKCSAPAFHRSRPRGGLEHFLLMLGANFFRCHACSDRNVFFAGLKIPAPEIRDWTLELIVAAILAGILTCGTIAFWILRKFHRLPF